MSFHKSTPLHLIDIDTASGKINWCQTWPGNIQGARFSQFALCIQWYVQGYRLPADTFKHFMLEKYLGAKW